MEDTLKQLGYQLMEKETMLTYFDIQSDEDTKMGRIVALDPKGPAAMSGFQVGDQITGYYPTRRKKPIIGRKVTTTYRFGLNEFDPHGEDAYIGVYRGDQNLKIYVSPRLIRGGYEGHWVADSSQVIPFFQYMAKEPRNK